MNMSSSLLVPEFLQMTVLNLVLGGTIFTEGGHYSPVNNVLGGQYSLVNNVRGDIFGGDTIHYDNGGQVLQVLGWALTRIRNLPLVRYSQAKGAVRWLCLERAVSCLAT